MDFYNDEELRKLRELKTPHIAVPQKFKDLSPTKPLNWIVRQKEEEEAEQIQKESEIKPNYNSISKDSPKLNSNTSINTHLTETTMDSYETALDYQKSHSVSSSMSNKENENVNYNEIEDLNEEQDDSNSTITRNHQQQGDTTLGLGIGDLSLSNPVEVTRQNNWDFEKPNSQSNSQSNLYNDDPTPKIEDYRFNNQYKYPPPSIDSPKSLDQSTPLIQQEVINSPQSINQYNNDPTPKIDDYEFNENYNYKPNINIKDQGGLLSTPKPKVFHPSHGSISYNVTPVLEPTTKESDKGGISRSTSPLNQTDAQIVEANQIAITPVKTSPRKTSTTSPIKKEVEQQDTSINDTSLGNDTTYSNESEYLKDLKKEKHNTVSLLSGGNDEFKGSNMNRNSVIFRTTKEDEKEVSLFLKALHSFDSNSLELTSDSAICLSFDANDVVFVHSVDTSGWGEVTMIKNFKRGWVPINYFTELIKTNENKLNKSKVPLKYLLISSSKFLRNPIDENDGGISINYINDIRDGVRYLLEQCDCLSRSTEIVKKKPIIRRIRKSLLADWYSLMIKADSYKHKVSLVHIETLQLMVLQVIRKSLAFLEIWGIENELLNKEKLEIANKRSIEKQKDKKSNIPYLSKQPYAKERLNEIHNLLFNYIGLILGRLDMIEHNPSGCQLLENLIHQMILLLREILYISKSCVLILNGRNTKVETKFDDNLDTLLSLVSELVSAVKLFVTKTIHENYDAGMVKVQDGLYYYSAEGDELIGIVSKMTRSISASVENCFRYITLIGDFTLGEEKRFPDFQLIKITPDSFIKTCSEGLLKTLDKGKVDLKMLQRSTVKRQSRFSMVRSGRDSELRLTSSGTNLLQEFLPDSKSFVRDSVFEPYLNESNDASDLQIPFDIKNEVVYDSQGKLIGASFRGLVYLLTDELTKPDQFLTSCFFLTFKLYSNGVELIEELIARFNITNKFDINDDYDELGEYSSYDSRLKNRRKLICKIFQIWLQSYWDYKNDYNLLPTLINFFNEGVSQFLPIESKKLIELCSKLTGLTPSKIKSSPSNSNTIISNLLSESKSSSSITNGSIQLVKRNLGLAKRSSVISTSSSVPSIVSINNDLDDDDYIFEEYELAKMNTTTRNSMLLPLPHLTFNNNSLLNKSQIHEIEALVLQYRRFLGSSLWESHNYSHYSPIDTGSLLDKWVIACQTPMSQVIKIDYNLVDLNSFEFAKQLTLIESRIFLSIKSEELLNGNFTQKNFKPNSSENISKSLLFTNLLSEYVFDSILTPGLSLKKRILRFKNWLNVGLSCYYLKNYNSLAAVIISLQNHILSRLDDIWLGLSEKYQNLFKDLMKIIHPNNNYKGYRFKISKLFDDNDSKCSVPLVPYINLFLQDLTFIDEGNKDFRNSNSFLRSKIINIDKFLKISKIVSNLEFLQVGYDHLQQSKKSKRSSIFSFNSGTSLNDNVAPLLPLQEFILLEFWRVHQLNLKEDDRYWKLSKRIKP
ncbi:Ras-specific guanine nucleotide-releasing factor 2 [Wickerhamomyces ciferrii]|uniref:Ras-specific guanine nucleotide-releasing factor 2 n=1 Tax=Wickerhamomyces ciferrii (strain ATCC 14091 / BCRC 22168 / CBS 111 / JCM 3599 / NBRC 0793 / NRRL Y-1031 F-60-10) TaxID=1206466 RepID=K0L0P2_WICCF|nr:Ras-specific guanine nucleotide-releasing factor 2 [Wickerhamomyces ciferrii]CCH47134.1 Ras-specific guanine nucleotide-releasing factor 2 [Wickerhamomyces ciferrii]